MKCPGCGFYCDRTGDLAEHMVYHFEEEDLNPKLHFKNPSKCPFWIAKNSTDISCPGCSKALLTHGIWNKNGIAWCAAFEFKQHLYDVIRKYMDENNSGHFQDAIDAHFAAVVVGMGVR